MKSINIDGVEIGKGYAPYIVAELSANHNGSIEHAKKIITEAARAKASAVKLQTYTPDSLTIDCNNQDFIVDGGLWNGMQLYELYGQAYTPYEWHKPLFDHARSEGITCFSSPFDTKAVDLLEDLNAPAYKIASFEMIDLALIKYVAQTKKPMIISTGMANYDEISEAIQCARENGCNDIILLHCISSYPAPIDSSNLAVISKLSSEFDVLTGLSDHSLGVAVSIASVAMGACFIEKHFTLNRDDKGPDSDFSIEPAELTELVDNANLVSKAIGVPTIGRNATEKSSIKFRRSLYFVKDINKGEVICPEHIRSIRPGYGLAPKYIDRIIGQKAISDAKYGDRVNTDYLDNKG